MQDLSSDASQDSFPLDVSLKIQVIRATSKESDYTKTCVVALFARHCVYTTTIPHLRNSRFVDVDSRPSLTVCRTFILLSISAYLYYAICKPVTYYNIVTNHCLPIRNLVKVKVRYIVISEHGLLSDTYFQMFKRMLQTYT